MDVTTAEGIIVALLLLVPGGLGDVLMRWLQGAQESSNDFRRMLAAVAWSVAALGLVETVNALLTDGAFGDFVLVPMSNLTTSTEGVSGLATRWVIFALVAALLPSAVRWATRTAVETRTRKTFARPSIDHVTRYARLHPGGRLRAKIQTSSGLIEGWLRWRSLGKVEDAAYIVEEQGSITWVPVQSMVWLQAVAPHNEAESQGTQTPAPL